MSQNQEHSTPEQLGVTTVASKVVILGIIVFMLAMTICTASAAQVSLSWKAPTTYTDGTPATTIGGYKIHMGTASKSYTTTVDVGNLTNYQINNIPDGTTYYFAVTAYDGAGNSSSYSNEVSKILPATYAITAKAGSGGSITPVGSTSSNTATDGTFTITTVYVTGGGSQSFSITPATGYKIATITVDGTTTSPNSTYSFTNVAADHSLVATFAPTAYTITASAGTGGTIAPTGASSVNHGNGIAYTITPSTGYKISDVKVDGTSVGAVANYTFSNVTANHTIAAAFTAATTTTYTITATAGTGGAISPAGTTTVTAGATQSYTITPSAGNKVLDVKVNGVSVGPVQTHTISNITANQSIDATFASLSTPTLIPSTTWKLKYTDSQETAAQNGAATNAFDGQKTSMWHTQWQSASPGYPHEIQIDLGNLYSLNSFTYLPRQDGSLNGTIAKYEFYVSNDGISWGTPVATGTFAKSANAKQVSFTAKKGRFIRLKALSEVNGGKWASAAEISVTGAAVAPSPAIPQANLRVKYVDSQETSAYNGAATNAIDAKTGTIWHTQWTNGSKGYPHELQLDLGRSYTVDGFNYLPRQDGSTNGNIADYEFYVSSDGVNWGTPVTKGTFQNSSAAKQMVFVGKAGRYVRLKALSEVSGGPWAAAAEVSAFGR